MTVDLRPLSLGELLDRTFTYYREQFWTFVGIMVPAEIAVVAPGLFLLALGLGPTSVLGTRPATPSQQIAAFGMLYATVSISILVSLLAHSIALGATSFAVSKIYLGSRSTIAEAYRSLKGSVGRVIGLYGLSILIVIAVYVLVIVAALLFTGLVTMVVRLAGLRSTSTMAGMLIGLIVILAFAGAIVVAAIVCMRFSLAVPALVLEKLGPVRALTRSSALAKGRLKQIFLACLLMSLIAAVISTAIQTPFWVAGLVLGFKFGHNPLWLAVPATIAGGVGGALGYPFLTIALTLFYFDSRVRKEGYDLQVMMSPSARPHKWRQGRPRSLSSLTRQLVSVRSFRGPTASLEAELARNVLKEEGIPSMLPRDMRREVIPRIDVVQLLVCEEDAARARAILEAFQNADAELLESDSSESSKTPGPDSQT